MNLTTTEVPVLSISEATLLHRQPRFGYIPLLAVFLSNLLSNTAVAKYIPLGALRLSYDPIPLLRPVSHPTPSHHHYQYGPPPPPPVSSEEAQHFYHHHHLPHINQNQIVNILDKKPTEIVVETDTEEATESSTEHQEYRDDGLEKPEIDEISDKSAKLLFKRDISDDKKTKFPPVASKKRYDLYSYHQKPRPLIESSATESSFEDPSRNDGIEKPALEEISERSVKMILKTEIDRQEYIDRGTPSNEGDGFIADPLPLFNKKKITSLYRTPTDKRNGEANQSSKSDGFEIFDKFDKGLLKKAFLNDQKILNNQYDYRSSSDHSNHTKSLAQKHQENLVRSGDGQWKSVGKRGEKMRRLMKRMTVGEDIGRASYVQNGTVPNFAKSSQNLSDMKENHTHVEAEIRSGIITAVSDGNPAFVEEVGSSDVDHQRKNSTITDGGESKPEVKEPENRMKKQVFDKINGRSNRALVKRGTANRYRVRKNNKYLYQKRRRVPDYYYDSYEDITSRYYRPRRRPSRPRKPIDSYEDYDSNEDYEYDYPELTKPQKNRRRPATTTRPRRPNPRPNNRRRVQTTTSEYDDDYAIEVIPRQGPTTITTGATDQTSSTTPTSTSTQPSSTTTHPTSTTTNATTTTGYGYGPSHGHEGVSITYGPPSGQGQGLYGPPSTSYGHPQTHYGPPSTHYGTPNNGFAPSSHGYYQVPLSDWYSNEVSRTAIAKKAQDIIGFENIFT